LEVPYNIFAFCHCIPTDISHNIKTRVYVVVMLNRGYFQKTHRGCMVDCQDYGRCVNAVSVWSLEVKKATASFAREDCNAEYLRAVEYFTSMQYLYKQTN